MTESVTALDQYLRHHAFVHRESVAKAFPANIDYVLSGLSETQLRARPHGLNSVVWLLWHLARVEDACVGFFVLSAGQVLDQDGWYERLGCGRRDLGTGMTKDEVAALSAAVSVDDLLEYRDAVGRRTRALLPSIWPEKWNGFVDPVDVDRAAAAFAIDPAAAAGLRAYLPSQTRESALMWWGLHHSMVHLGQLMMLRGLLLGAPV